MQVIMIAAVSVPPVQLVIIVLVMALGLLVQLILIVLRVVAPYLVVLVMMILLLNVLIHLVIRQNIQVGNIIIVMAI